MPHNIEIKLLNEIHRLSQQSKKELARTLQVSPSTLYAIWKGRDISHPIFCKLLTCYVELKLVH